MKTKALLKATKEKLVIRYKRNPIKIMVEFSEEIL